MKRTLVFGAVVLVLACIAACNNPFFPAAKPGPAATGGVTLGGTADVQINGNAPDEIRVTVRDEDGNYLGEAAVDEDGNWTLEIPQPDNGGDLIIEVTAVDEDGNEVKHETVISPDKDGKYPGTIDLGTMRVTIAGNYLVGEELSVTVEGIEAQSYRWQAGGVDINGAVNAKYTIEGADAGKILSCVVGYEGGTVTISGSKAPFTMRLDVKQPQAGDSVSFNAAGTGTGHEGDKITLHYTLRNLSEYNTLRFSGKADLGLAAVETAGSGTVEYTVNAAHAEQGEILITATFLHDDEKIIDEPYKIVLDVMDAESGDSISFDDAASVVETTGYKGETVTLYYTVGDAKEFNKLRFSGKAGSGLAPAEEAGSGTVEYVIDAAHAELGEIIIIATFWHDDKTEDPIAFEIPDEVEKTYGDAPFTNVITDEHNGTGDITYSITDEHGNETDVAEIDAATGEVTILKVGNAIVTALKEADDVYAHDKAEYELTVNPKPVTITGVSATDREYDGTTTVALSGGTLAGVEDVDTGNVNITLGNGTMADANAGNGKSVTTNIQLTGSAAGNYVLTQPESVTADISKRNLSNAVVSVSGTFTYNGSAHEPTPTVSDSGAVIAASDWTVSSYSGNTNAGTAVVTITATVGGNYTGTQTGNFAIGKADPTVTWPDDLSAYHWQTLANISLVSYTNGGTGAFAWTAAGSTSVGALGIRSYNMTFTPTDTANYNTVTKDVNITVRHLLEADDIVQIPFADVAGPPYVFTMGQTDVATPEHQVTLTRGFTMSKYQVTQEQYEAVMGVGEDRTTTTYGKGDNYPVYYVSWYDAIVFCNKLSVMEGLTPVYYIETPGVANSEKPEEWAAVPTSSNTEWNTMKTREEADGYRLPTEAQWEYACRAGTTTIWYTGDSEDAALQAAAWYSANAESKTHEVGLKTPNAWGLYDMMGNVYEWCWDWYGNYTGDETDPVGASSGSGRVFRGGGWAFSASGLRSAFRGVDDPNYRGSTVGFRLLRP